MYASMIKTKPIGRIKVSKRIFKILDKVKSGKFGQSSGFGQRPCFFHF